MCRVTVDRIMEVVKVWLVLLTILVVQDLEALLMLCICKDSRRGKAT